MVDIIDCNVDIKAIRNVEIDDLLGRETVSLDMEQIFSYLKDKTIMVTGGGGTIGSELCRQVATYEPKKLVILDNYENKDRKSTRLNSSHANISYAVFCLKKKKQNTTRCQTF